MLRTSSPSSWSTRVSESLRQALVDFLNQQGYAVHPTAGVEIDHSYDGLQISWINGVGDSWQDAYPSPQDLCQFLLEYSIV